MSLSRKNRKRAGKVEDLFTLLVFLWGFQLTTAGQSAIFLVNPSFEGRPRYASLPQGWKNCAFNTESPPDLHPVVQGNYGVVQKPFDGKTYIGLVVRDNGSTESLGQMLPQPLVAGQCYTFSLYLCRSNHLQSKSRRTGTAADYNSPISLKIWGGISPCGQKELLAVSPVIADEDWKKYDFQLHPKDSLTWLSFEASYDHNPGEPYNGNILLDQASPILPANCNTGDLLINTDTLHIPSFNLPVESPSPTRSGKRKFLFFRF
jgi:hypothetical protein